MEKQTKFILIGLGVVAAGTGGYFLYQHLQKKNDENDVQDFQDQITSGDIALPASPTKTPRPASIPSGYKPKPANSTFPLKKGSKGTLVKDIQNAMVKQYGGAIFPKYGADGYWGAELQTALTSKNLPLVIDATAYGKILGGKIPSAAKPTGKPSAEISSSAISKLLHTAIDKDDIFAALDALKKIKNTAKYTTVNTEFKKVYIANAGVRKTVVTALSDQFSSAEYKKKINAELYRIGLKYNGKVWSLSGLGGTSRLVTISPTKIWDNWGTTIEVPRSTILGDYLNAGNGATEFQALDGRIFLVNTNHIRYEQ